MLRNLSGETREVVDSALRELAEIRKRWDELDTGAVARSAADRAESASAMLKVERAERAVADAEKARTEALTAALADREARVAAEKAAEEAAQETAAVRKAAWEQTAEHERARGQAETRATLAEQGQRTALERLEATRRELGELAELQQDTARRLAEALAFADRAEAARTLAEEKIAAAEERARLATETAQEKETARRAEEERARRAQEALDNEWRARQEAETTWRAELERARQAQDEAAAERRETTKNLARVQTAYGEVLARLSHQDKEIQQLRAQLADAVEHKPDQAPGTPPETAERE
ncbi:hypothetical protein [Actinocrispum sp. NPDC049592]|uniref:hypothetical protein n=1 Tax=Actinocrispum sp. NPDC049592 TaxID=3154835 RepID=UPI003420E937